MRDLSRNARLYVLAEVPMAIGAGGFATVYNLYILALGYAPAFLGALLTVTLAGAGAAALPAGALVDRCGPRAVLLGASVATAAGVAVQLVAPLAVPLLTGSVVAGAGVGAFYVAAAPFLAENSPAGRRTSLFTLDVVTVLAGRAAGSAAGGVAVVLLGAGGFLAAERYRLTLVGAAAITATAIIPLLLTRGHPLPDGSSRHVPPGDGAGRRAPARKGGSLPLEAMALGEPHDGRESGPAPGRLGQWRLAVGDRLVLRLAAVAAVMGLGTGLFLPYVNVFFIQGLGATAALFGWLSAGALGLRLVGTLLAPWVAGRYGAVRAAAGAQLASIPLLLLLGFAPDLVLAGTAMLLCWAVMNVVGPIQAGFTMDALRPEVRGAANSLVWLATYGATGLSTLAGGALISVVGYRLPYLLASALFAASALLLWRWFVVHDPTSARPLAVAYS